MCSLNDVDVFNGFFLELRPMWSGKERKVTALLYGAVHFYMFLFATCVHMSDEVEFVSSVQEFLNMYA